MAIFSIQNLLYYSLFILPLLWMKQIVMLGENVFPLLIVLLESVLLCKKILSKKRKKVVIKTYSVDKAVSLILAVYALGKIVSFSIGLFSSGLMDMEFYTLMLAVAGIYLLMDFSMEENPYWQKAMVMTGAIGSFIILLPCLKGFEGCLWTDGLTVANDGIVAYLLLGNILSITNWIFLKEEGKQNIVWFLMTAFQMFVLLLHQSHVSNWIIVLCLLGIISFFRPRATVIKKTGILLFLFLFLWSNMSLLLNYTKWFLVKAGYSLETSVYMELFLALGGLVFFHYWDRLPEGIDLQKISMVKMQHCFRMFFWILTLIFFMFVCGGEVWQSLEEHGINGFVKALASPINAEITSGSSTIFVWITELGIVWGVFIFIALYQAGAGLAKRCGKDNARENCFMIFFMVFLTEILIWEIPGNVLFLFVLLMALGNQKKE